MQKSNAKPANVEINSLVLQSFESDMEKYIKNHSIWLEKLWFLPFFAGSISYFGLWKIMGVIFHFFYVGCSVSGYKNE